ncbi:YqzE family protein [Gordoniibacillus kamchatkensis]|uniref:YqzE family protein n=1 Tax=Gordoniibacillus kamchatkensis TaxID=1590651 RepID=UPI000696C0C3|nr:YqzE family protein [Paenibacillus sp. VKM B-2647]
MAKSDELIKYITQRVVTYMDTPPDERRRTRESVKVRRGRWDVRWFGMLPLAAAMWLRGLRGIWRSLRRLRAAGSGGHDDESIR